MRYFLVSLLFIFFASDAQVTLPDNVARFYLERHFIAKKQQEQLDIRQRVIDNLNEQLGVKDSIIVSHTLDQESYLNIIRTKEQQLTEAEALAKEKDKIIKKHRTQKKLIMFGSVILIVLVAL
jgi:hypothetical protein